MLVSVVIVILCIMLGGFMIRIRTGKTNSLSKKNQYQMLDK